MVERVSMRELRNNTRSVIEKVSRDGQVILTDYGTDVAVIQHLDSAWSDFVDRVFSDTPPARDTGMLTWLAEDDAASMSDAG